MRSLVVVGALAFALTACKFPSLTPAEKAAPPPLAAPSLKPVASAPPATTGAQGAYPCACAGEAKAPKSIYAAAPSHGHAAAASARRTVRTHRAAASGGSRYETHGGQGDSRRADETYAGSGAVSAAAAGDTERAYASSGQVFESRSVEERSYESRSYESQQSSGGYQTVYQDGYVEGFGHSPYAPQTGYTATRDYIVRRSVRDDVARSRAWTRVR